MFYFCILARLQTTAINGNIVLGSVLCMYGGLRVDVIFAGFVTPCLHCGGRAFGTLQRPSQPYLLGFLSKRCRCVVKGRLVAFVLQGRTTACQHPGWRSFGNFGRVSEESPIGRSR